MTDAATLLALAGPMPRNELGQAVSRKCPDPNCGGMLVYEPHRASWSGPAQHYWRCDGLTHERAEDDLEACPYDVWGPLILHARAAQASSVPATGGE